MASRGRQTFNKRLKEQQRKEKQQEKFARRLQRKSEEGEGAPIEESTDDLFDTALDRPDRQLDQLLEQSVNSVQP